MSVLKNRVVFYGQALRAAKQVGAFSFTSKIVAEKVTETIPARRSAVGRPLRVLEVGAGTGAITKVILDRLAPGDRLDLYEINPEFARVLRAEFGSISDPILTIHGRGIEECPGDARYDAIVSSLPLLNMEPDLVRRIFTILVDRLEPEGVLSYYDYWAKEIRKFIGDRGERTRVRAVLDVTREFLERHEYRRGVIPWNVPPAHVHYLRKQK